MKNVTVARWLPVTGYEGLYEVSDHGGVRKLPRRGNLVRPMCERLTPKGYARVRLRRNGVRRSHFVHRLVAIAFLGPVPPGMEVRHGPAGKRDNQLANLSYGTRAQNMADKRRDDTVPDQRGERNPAAKLTVMQVREIRQRYAAGGVTQRKLAAEYGVGQTTIRNITSGQHWSSAA